jgi:hypothetical protein
MPKKVKQADQDRKATSITGADVMSWLQEIESSHNVLVRLTLDPALMGGPCCWSVSAQAYKRAVTTHPDLQAESRRRWTDGDGRSLQGVMMRVLIDLDGQLHQQEGILNLPF